MATLNLEPTLTLNVLKDCAKAFIVVGAGGTGGYFIPHLARQVALQNKLRRAEGYGTPHKILIVEGDIVEEKNLTRQNFIHADINKNKGQVMAERYGAAFGLEINFLDQYIESKEQFEEIVRNFSHRDNHLPVLVDCVDNNKTRVIMHEVFEVCGKTDNAYWLSSGNEQYNGQVVCGHKQPYPSNFSDCSTFNLPSVTEMFPEVLEGGDKLPTELSCDEAAVSAPQNIMTNMVAANLLFNFANIILTADAHNPENRGLKHFATTFDTQNGTFNTFMNKKSVIQSKLPAQE